MIMSEWIVGEADDRRCAAVEVAGCNDDHCPTVWHTLDLVTPLASDLDRGLHSLGAVHRQHHVLADQRGQPFGKGRQLIVVEGARRQRESLELLLGGGDECRMTVSEVRGRVRREEIQVLLTVGVGEHRAGSASYHNIQRVVVVSDVLILELQQLAGMREGVVRGDHDDAPAECREELSGKRSGVTSVGAGLISWVQHFTLPPPLISSLRSTEIGQ